MVAGLLAGQRFAVLSTASGMSPYANLIAFWAPDDLAYVVFATMRATRKFNYLAENPHVALLFDNRSNRGVDVREAMAVTATGTAREFTPAERDEVLTHFLAKHPHLESFVASPGCALVGIDIDTYYVVTRFQNVVELHMRAPHAEGG